jgi:hypothetical protein
MAAIPARRLAILAHILIIIPERKIPIENPKNIPGTIIATTAIPIGNLKVSVV